MVESWRLHDLETRIGYLESVNTIKDRMATGADLDSVWEHIYSLEDEVEELKKQLEDMDDRLERIESFIKELKDKIK
jgi:archaellum component FlaC